MGLGEQSLGESEKITMKRKIKCRQYNKNDCLKKSGNIISGYSDNNGTHKAWIKCVNFIFNELKWSNQGQEDAAKPLRRQSFCYSCCCFKRFKCLNRKTWNDTESKWINVLTNQCKIELQWSNLFKAVSRWANYLIAFHIQVIQRKHIIWIHSLKNQSSI